MSGKSHDGDPFGYSFADSNRNDSIRRGDAGKLHRDRGGHEHVPRHDSAADIERQRFGGEPELYGYGGNSADSEQRACRRLSNSYDQYQPSQRLYESWRVVIVRFGFAVDRLSSFLFFQPAARPGRQFNGANPGDNDRDGGGESSAKCTQ